MTTSRQKRAVAFCERMVGVKFSGDLDDYNSVSVFLRKYLERARIEQATIMDNWYGEEPMDWYD